MNYSIVTLIITAAILLAMMVSLTFKPKVIHRLNLAAVCFAGAVGLVFYGLGYGSTVRSAGESLVVASQAVDSTLSMFGGKDSFSALIEHASWFAENTWLQVLYWLALLAAIYFTAAMVLGTLGKQFLRIVREFLLPKRNRIALFYNITDESLRLAEKICSDRKCHPVFIGDCQNEVVMQRISDIGGLIWPVDLIDIKGEWLLKLGITDRELKKVKMFVMAENDADANVFLQRVLLGVSNKKVSSLTFDMTVICEDEQEFAFLHKKQSDGHYLLADICSYKNMASKALVNAVSPYNLVDFDENGNAVESFDAIIVGFGRIGQSLLCELIRNSQFSGKQSRIMVVDNRYKEKAGAFLTVYNEMIEHYNIRFVELDVFSEDFYNFMLENGKEINLIAMCMGDRKKNHEAAAQIRFIINRKRNHFNPGMIVATCSKKKINIFDSNNYSIDIPDVKELIEGSIDKGARNIHKVYVRNRAEALYPGDSNLQEAFYEETWYETDLYSRMSCEASAAFMPALYKAAGIDSQDEKSCEKINKAIEDNPKLLTKLSELEHLRWNAFQYTMGVIPMSETEFRRRVDKALAETENERELLKNYYDMDKTDIESAESALERIHKACNYVRKELNEYGFGGIHACLAEWDELDRLWDIYLPLASALSEAEYHYSVIQWRNNPEGKEKPVKEELSDFKKLDTNNINQLLGLIS